jgi:hypothetical protein
LYLLPKKKRADVAELLSSEDCNSDDQCIELAKHLIASKSVVSTSTIRGSLAFSTE